MVERNRVTSGLAGLLEGLYTGMENKKNRAMQERQLSFQDPNRPFADRELFEMVYKQSQPNVLENILATNMGGQPMPSPQMPDIIQQFRQLQALLSGQQQMPQAIPQQMPQQPAQVSKGGFSIPTLQQLQQARKSGAVGFDDELGAFVDANGNRVM